jgi:tetratricopeptide (TPR) repeat protein
MTALATGCAATATAPDRAAARGEGGDGDANYTRSAPERSQNSVRVEPDGAHGFTLSEVVRVDGDVRRDYQRGAALLQAGDLEAGVEVLETVVERAPEVTNPHIDLGIAYAHLGRLEASEASLRTALALSPNHPAALNELGILQRRTGKFAAARESYERALIGHPGFHFALLNLGVLCDLYLEDLACALESYSRYEAIVPDDRDVAIWIADVERRLAGKE